MNGRYIAGGWSVAYEAFVVAGGESGGGGGSASRRAESAPTSGNQGIANQPEF